MDKRKRTILMADDEFINREILGEILKDRYDVLFAENGRETMDRIREHGETLSLVLLDLIMPEMHGTEVLRCMKADPVLSLRWSAFSWGRWILYRNPIPRRR